ncbi:MAG: hypothetical protein EBR54_05685 [Flavobacteriia bacterium]|jgi:hypothetical protein|nr:hypothetical protein [Flavobacteriia bacterium]NBX38887.1 hypothetical protein [Flavobacteriia bacterium]
MSYFWLAIAFGSFGVVTYNGFTSGFDRWASYYVFTVIAIGMFFMKKWMMKRTEQHQAYLRDQADKTKGNL